MIASLALITVVKPSALSVKSNLEGPALHASPALSDWLRKLRQAERDGRILSVEASSARQGLSQQIHDKKADLGQAVQVSSSIASLIGLPPAPLILARRAIHNVSDGQFEVVLSDHVSAPALYEGYYRSNGFRHYGPRIAQMRLDEWQRVVSESGISTLAGRVIYRVAGLEGGYESLNTFDTGGVSSGILQFASLLSGSGSLVTVMQECRTLDSSGYRQAFVDHGVDVDSSGSLIALAEDGTWKAGPQAVNHIAASPKLAALFIRAGRIFKAYRLAQVRIAERLYYPAGRILRLDVGGRQFFTQIGSIIRSEDGLAIVMDRYVHTGKVDSVRDAINLVIREKNLKTPTEASRYEDEILDRIIHRRDFRLKP